MINKKYVLIKFSWQEVLDTGISAAFAGWNAGSLGVNTLEEVGKIGATKAMLMAGGESVTEQLANLAAGFSHKFDLKEVIVSMLSAGANAEIPSDSQIIHTALTSVGSNVATQEWETHHLDVESLAANVLGTTLGQAATNTIEKGAAEFASELKAYVEAQFASMTNGNGQTNVMPAKAGVQKNNQDASNSDAAQSSADTPSNRYAKLQKQSQDADPSSDPGNDPDANNSSTNSNNSSASGNQSKAARWNQSSSNNKDWNPFAIPSMQDDFAEAYNELLMKSMNGLPSQTGTTTSTQQATQNSQNNYSFWGNVSKETVGNVPPSVAFEGMKQAGQLANSELPLLKAEYNAFMSEMNEANLTFQRMLIGAKSLA